LRSWRGIKSQGDREIGEKSHREIREITEIRAKSNREMRGDQGDPGEITHGAIRGIRE
jgi:hypothetical protein